MKDEVGTRRDWTGRAPSDAGDWRKVEAFVAATCFICSRSAFRPELFVARQAFNARSRKAFSAGATESLSRASSSHPVGLPRCCSICRANLSPIGRDDLIWLHMLGEICNIAANVCSSPLGGAPEASAFSA